MRQLFATILCSIFAISLAAQPSQRVGMFQPDEIMLKPSAFSHAQELDIQYVLSLDADRLLAPYRRSCGLEPKAENYTNWENTGLDGHIGGHYLSALSYLYAATGNDDLGERLAYFLNELKECQDAVGTGYLAGVPDGQRIFDEIAKGEIHAEPFGLNGGWVPLYNLHKIFAGLRDAYVVARQDEALPIFLRLADWWATIIEGLTNEQVQDMLRSEHGGLNEVMADAAAIANEKRYIVVARRLCHEALLRPLVEGRDELTGMHANTQIPKVIGFQRIAELTGDKDLARAARFFWQTVTRNRTTCIGGNSVREHFNDPLDCTELLMSEQGPETCNTYNMLRLSRMLYAATGNHLYVDYYERALYNHILSSQNDSTGGLVYFTPLRPGHYRVYSQPQTSMWCCVGSGIESHGRYSDMIYAHRGDTLIVNLYIPSNLVWQDRDIVVGTEVDYAAEEAATIVLRQYDNQPFVVKLRCPDWTSVVTVTINGEPTLFDSPDGYIAINREWQEGDRIRLSLPMSLSAEQLPDSSAFTAYRYGPFVMAARLPGDTPGQFADDSRGGHIAQGAKMPLAEVPYIVSTKRELLDQVSGTGLHKRLSVNINGHSDTLDLVPFHTLHNSRYAIYFPYGTEEQHAAFLADTLNERAVREALDYRTIDRVVCGEQQPESDHNASWGKSTTGNDGNIHWRRAEDYMTYDLHVPDFAAVNVRIEYEGNSGNAKVTFDGAEIGAIGTTDGGRQVATLQVGGARKDGKYTLRITAEDSATPKIYDIRTLHP